MSNDIGCASPLEKFVLVMKEEMDVLHGEVQILRQQLSNLQDKQHVFPDLSFHIEGSKTAMRFYIRIQIGKQVSSADFVTLLYTKSGIPSCRDVRILNRECKHPIFGHKRYIIEIAVQCTEYIMLGNLAKTMSSTLSEYWDDQSLAYILNLDRDIDWTFTCRDIDLANMKHENTSIPTFFRMINGCVTAQQVVMNDIPLNHALKRREYPLITIPEY